MKFTTALLLLLIPSLIFCQAFAKADLVAQGTSKGVKPSIFFSAGSILKDKETNKKTCLLAAGFGLLFPNFNNQPYIPLFIEGGYFQSLSKFSPYIAGKIGYSIYNGSSDFIGKEGEGKGGMYLNLRAGLGATITKKSSIIPFAGFTYLIMRRTGVQNEINIQKTLFDAGIAIVML